MMRFTVPGPPVGKARARTVLNRGRVHSYTPNKTTAYESTVRLAFAKAFPRHVPLTGPIWLEVTAYFQPPSASSCATARRDTRAFHTSRGRTPRTSPRPSKTP